ncbi:MAG TPA: ComEC/Rec2 family competence protein [Candidatus Saccharimonadales bacterium]
MWRARQVVHSSWQVAVLGIGIFAGVVLAPALKWEFLGAISWLLTGILLGLIAITRQRAYLLAVALVGGLLIGLWRGSLEVSNLHAYDSLYGQAVTLRGVVSDDADTDKRGAVVLRLGDISLDGKVLSGKLWVTLAEKPEVKRSDIVTVSGQLEKGFGTFAGSMYRAEVSKIERPAPGDIALRVRDWFAAAIHTAIPDPEASLGVGYLVGQRRDLPAELDNALKLAGLTHIVVASGYNLTILVRLARRLFEKISKYLSFISAGGMIVSFVAITGMSPSMSRAGLVAGLSLLAWYYGRKIHPLVLLPLAVAATVLINPSYAWGDVSWQLSFAAFAGVMILAPLLQAFYFGAKKPGIVRQILGETISATLMTLPIILLYFGQMSNVAIPANLLILPLVPLAMLLTFIAGIGALLLPTLGWVIGYPAYLLLSYMTQTAQFFANLPWATTEIEITPWHAVVMYGILIALMIFMWQKTKLNLRNTNIIE